MRLHIISPFTFYGGWTRLSILLLTLIVALTYPELNFRVNHRQFECCLSEPTNELQTRSQLVKTLKPLQLNKTLLLSSQFFLRLLCNLSIPRLQLQAKSLKHTKILSYFHNAYPLLMQIIICYQPNKDWKNGF